MMDPCKHSLRILFWIIGISCISGTGRADDSSRGVPLPSLRSLPVGSVTATSATVSLTSTRVSVSIMLGRSEGSVRVITPKFTWLGEGEPYPDRQFPELGFALDNKKVEIESVPYALAEKRNISPLLREINVNPFLITQSPPLFSVKYSPELATLLKIGAIATDENGFLAQWSAYRSASVKVKAGTKSLTMTYIPRPAYALRKMPELLRHEVLSKYCLTSNMLTQNIMFRSNDRFYLATEYEIPTSLDERAGVALTVDTSFRQEAGHKNAFVAFCSTGGTPAVDAEKSQPGRTDDRGVLRVLVLEHVKP